MAEASQTATAPADGCDGAGDLPEPVGGLSQVPEVRLPVERRGGCAALHRFLTGEVARPYRFLDLACGDASGIVDGAQGQRPSSTIAASICRRPLWRLRRTILRRCLVRPSSMRPISARRCAILRHAADIVWISLSLHHLDTAAKLAFMREVRQGIDAERRVPHLRAGAARRRGPARVPRPARGDRPPRLDEAHAGRVRRGHEARAHVRPA